MNLILNNLDKVKPLQITSTCPLTYCATLFKHTICGQQQQDRKFQAWQTVFVLQYNKYAWSLDNKKKTNLNILALCHNYSKLYRHNTLRQNTGEAQAMHKPDKY